MRLHFGADPQKRDGTWASTLKGKIGERGFRREYEIDWAAPAGEPVVPEYDIAVHRGEVSVDRTLRLLRFWDFGQVSPVVLFAQLTAWDQLRVLRELCPFNVSLRRLVPMVQAMTVELGCNGVPFDAGDPAGHNQTDLGASAQVLQTDYGITLHSTRPGTEVSYAKFRQRLLERRLVPGRGQVSAFVADPACSNLHEALAGAFRRSEHAPYKPVPVHPYKDVVDAVRYGHDCLEMLTAAHHQAMAKVAQSDVRQLRSAPQARPPSVSWAGMLPEAPLRPSGRGTPTYTPSPEGSLR